MTEATAIEEVPTAAAVEPEAPKPKAKVEPKVEWIVDRDEFADAVAKAARAAGSSGRGSDSLSNLRLHFANSRLTVSGTDLELGVSVKIPVQGRTGGTAFISARLLANVVKAIDTDAVTMSIADEVLRVKAGQFVTELVSGDGEGFVIPAPPTTKAKTLNAIEFAAAVSATAFAASSEDARPILTGVYVHSEGGHSTFAATDSYRLSVARTGLAPLADKVIVPKRALVEVTRMIGDADELEVRMDKESASFTVGDRVLVTRLIDGEFPKYGQLIPKAKAPTTVTVDRLALMAAVRRVNVAAVEADTPVRLVITKARIMVHAIEVDVADAKEPVPAKLTGKAMEIAFNGAFLHSVLSSFDEDEVTLCMSSADRLTLVHGGAPKDREAVLMPVRVS